MKFKEYLAKTPNPLVIQELFNNPVKFERQSGGSPNSKEYQFDVGEKHYEVKFYEAEVKKYPDSYEIIFILTRVGGDRVIGWDTEAITGTGDQVAVFSTVANILKDFVQSYKPNIIYFSAKEQSRIKLYTTLSKRLSKMSYLKNDYITTYKGKRYFINSREELYDPFVFMRDIT